ncbi:hypothetical protein [Marinobacter similis]|uniref:hypothetical protein n=1 Tax=Marinobacter similis TaxID=1420916 RepID=UPI000AC0CE22|nr:hypothetical protein [Marinobacter similis]
MASAGNLVLRQRDLGGPYVRVYALRHQPGKLTAPPPVSTPVLSPWPEPVQKADVARPEALMSDALAMPTRDDGTQALTPSWRSAGILMVAPTPRPSAIWNWAGGISSNRCFHAGPGSPICSCVNTVATRVWWWGVSNG